MKPTYNELVNMLELTISNFDGVIMELVGTEHWDKGYVALCHDDIRKSRKMIQSAQNECICNDGSYIPCGVHASQKEWDSFDAEIEAGIHQ